LSSECDTKTISVWLKPKPPSLATNAGLSAQFWFGADEFWPLPPISHAITQDSPEFLGKNAQSMQRWQCFGVFPHDEEGRCMSLVFGALVFGALPAHVRGARKS
jgi:hypothetical protein